MEQMFSLPAVHRNTPLKENNPLKETWTSPGERTQSEWTSELGQSPASLTSWNHAVVILFPQNPEAQPVWGHQALHPLRQGSGPDAIPNGVQGAAHVEHPGQG